MVEKTKKSITFGCRKGDLGWKNLDFGKVDTSKPFVIALPGGRVNYAEDAARFCACIEDLLGIKDVKKSLKPCNVYSCFAPVIQYSSLVDYYNEISTTNNLNLNFDNQDENIFAVVEFAKNFVAGIFIPMIKSCKTIEQLAKKFRNATFVSFCFGSILQSAINVELRKSLLEFGFSPETAKRLESQICVLRTAAIVLESPTGESCVSFVSLSDEEIGSMAQFTNIKKQFTSHRKDGNVGVCYQDTNKNTNVIISNFSNDYFFSGDKLYKETNIFDHNAAVYLRYAYDLSPKDRSTKIIGGALSTSLAFCLKHSIANAVNNCNSDNFTPLTKQSLYRKCKIVTDIINAVNIEKNMQNASRLTINSINGNSQMLSFAIQGMKIPPLQPKGK